MEAAFIGKTRFTEIEVPNLLVLSKDPAISGPPVNETFDPMLACGNVRDQ